MKNSYLKLYPLDQLRLRWNRMINQLSTNTSVLIKSNQKTWHNCFCGTPGLILVSMKTGIGVPCHSVSNPNLFQIFDPVPLPLAKQFSTICAYLILFVLYHPYEKRPGRIQCNCISCMVLILELRYCTFTEWSQDECMTTLFPITCICSLLPYFLPCFPSMNNEWVTKKSEKTENLPP